MDSVLKFVFAFDDKLTPALGNIGKGIADNNKAIGSFGNQIDKIASKAMGFQSLANSFGAVTSVLNDAIAPGIAFNTSVAELSAITGFVGKDLDKLSISARNNALTFGGDAASAAGVYQRVLSDLGPDIAKNSEAMSVMANNAQIMGKTMKGDVIGAASALDTAMLQYGVDLSNPIKASKTMTEYMNVMGAAAQQGSVDVPLIAQALEQAGATAKSVGVNFAETNAAIQTLALGGLKGAEAGRGLKNVLVNMAAPTLLTDTVIGQAQKLGVNLNVVANNALPLKDRLKELSKGMGDTAFMAGYFGRENLVAGQALLGNISFLGDMQGKIVGTNATVEMANTIMNSFSERLSRSKAAMSDLGISIFGSTEAMVPFMNGAVGIAEGYSRLYPAISLVTSGFSWVTGAIWSKIKATRADIVAQGWSATIMNSSLVQLGKLAAGYIFTGVTAVGSFVAGIFASTVAMFGFNGVMLANPIGLFIVGLVAIGGAVYLAIKHWDWLKNAIVVGATFLMKLTPFYWLTQAVDYLFPSFTKAIGSFFTNIYENWIKPFFGWIGEIWDKLKAVIAPFSSDFSFNANVGINSTVAESKPILVGGMGIADIVAPKTYSANSGVDYAAETSGKTYNKVTGKFEEKPTSNKVTKSLIDLNSGKKDKDKKDKGGKDAEVSGDNKQSRIVNTRIDRIVINVNAKGDDAALRDTGDKYARKMVEAHRDFETILGN